MKNLTGVIYGGKSIKNDVRCPYYTEKCERCDFVCEYDVSLGLDLEKFKEDEERWINMENPELLPTECGDDCKRNCNDFCKNDADNLRIHGFEDSEEMLP